MALATGKYHYSVLTAFDRQWRVWLAHDGSRADAVFGFADFDKDHAEGDRWALFVVSRAARPTGLPPAMHMEFGLQAERRGWLKSATHHYEAAAWNSSTPQSLLNLSNVAIVQKAWPRAEAILRMALIMEPESMAVANNLAWVILNGGGDLREAERLARRALADPQVGRYAADTLTQVLEAIGARGGGVSR